MIENTTRTSNYFQERETKNKIFRIQYPHNDHPNAPPQVPTELASSDTLFFSLQQH